MSFEKHPTLKIIHDYYQRRFRSGSLAMWHAFGIASIYIKSNEKDKHNPILSSLVIADAGSFKSQIMNYTKKTFSLCAWSVPDQPTDRAIVREFKKNPTLLNDKVFYIDDVANAFPTLESTREQRLVGLFTKGIMEGDYAYADFSSTESMKARFGLYANVAQETFMKIRDMLEANTFLERIVPFNFILSDAEVKEICREFRHNYNYGAYPKIKIKGNLTTKKVIETPEEFDAEFEHVINMFKEFCGLSIPRADMWATCIMKSIAILEGRDKVIKEDFDLFGKHILPSISMDTRIKPVERAIMTLLRINKNANVQECYEFFKSETFLIDFPYDSDFFTKIPYNDMKYNFERAKKYVDKENISMKSVGVEINVI
jgi:hypothetical protein